jgi:hypothetical protein
LAVARKMQGLACGEEVCKLVTAIDIFHQADKDFSAEST